MNDEFSLEICSDLDYEGMTVDISYLNDLIASLNQDKGSENIEIKLYSPKDKEHWNFSYEEFMLILKKAKELLIQINRNPK